MSDFENTQAEVSKIIEEPFKLTKEAYDDLIKEIERLKKSLEDHIIRYEKESKNFVKGML